jgi:hypothetical protein
MILLRYFLEDHKNSNSFLTLQERAIICRGKKKILLKIELIPLDRFYKIANITIQ